MEKAQTSAIGRFFKGMVSSAVNSTVMMGIFYGLQHLAGMAHIFGMAPLTLAVVPQALLVVAAVAVFGGVMAAMRGNHHSHGAGHGQHREAQQAVLMAQSRGLAPIMTPMGPIAEEAPEVSTPATTRWTERPDIAQSNRPTIAQILADGQSPKDHAAAILAAQQQTSNAASR